MADIKESIKRVHRKLGQVHQVNQCGSCECLLDVLENVMDDLGQIRAVEADTARAEMQCWLEEGNKNRHQCLGCEVCLPIEPYNQFSALVRDSSIDMLPTAETIASTPCNCGDT